MNAVYVAVVGPAEAKDEEMAVAERVGELLARAGSVVVTGGLGGVMTAAGRGALAAGGQSVGLLPGRDRSAGNPYLSIALPTGLGELRNGLVIGVADAVVAVGGSWGTLSEIALARRAGKPVITIGGWRVGTARGEQTLAEARTPEEAVADALAAIGAPG